MSRRKGEKEGKDEHSNIQRTNKIEAKLDLSLTERVTRKAIDI